jgi:acetolactate synthase I/II/III large subunit
MPTGGEILVNVLATEGVQHVFTVPGESFIAALDAMHGDCSVRPITCRSEGGAAMMAEATGKLTGRPGVAMVSRGPGAANAAPGVYVAHQDATPLILFVGLPPRSMNDLPAFQAIDLDGIFGKISKWVVTVSAAAHLDRVLMRAFRTAMTGRRGPVVIGLPEDVLAEIADPARHVRTNIAPIPIQTTDLDFIRNALAYAERPLVIVGGSEWTVDAAKNLAIFAERFDMPVVAAFRRQDTLDNRHRCYAGHAGFSIDPSLAAGLKTSDLVIALGAELNDVTTQGFSLLDGRNPEQKIIRIASDAFAQITTAAVTQSVVASPVLAIAALASMSLPGARPPWGIWRRDLRAAYEASLKPKPTPGTVKLEAVISEASQILPDDAIISNGAGNYAAFLHRYYVYKSFGTELAPISGSMGYGLPAAIAAKLVHPQRTVVAFAGDGCFQMTSQELMTAVQFGLAVVIVIANNGTLGTIRMHQERRYPGRVVATSLMNPDFVAWAKSCGAYAERIEATGEFASALRRAVVADRPTIIELMLDSDAISPLETIQSIRASAPKPDST